MISLSPTVRHATAAYQALSQGVASKRRTKSFDMAALPSVPELNAAHLLSRTSQEVRSSNYAVHAGLPHLLDDQYFIVGTMLFADCTHWPCRLPP